jgi:hypothetical protein
VAELLRLLKITDVDAAACVQDVGGAGMYFKRFADDVVKTNYSVAVGDASRGLNALSTSMNGCGVTEVTTKLDALAAAIKWAHVSTAGLDKAVSILVGASDLWQDVEALAAAVHGGGTTAAGQALAALLEDWSSITGGCAASNSTTTCKFMDGFLKTLSVAAEEIAPCEAALAVPIANVTAAAASFRAKDYKLATQQILSGLEGVARAISTDACGLSAIGQAVSKNLPALANAVVTVESATDVKILVGSADIYDDLYNAVEGTAALRGLHEAVTNVRHEQLRGRHRPPPSLVPQLYPPPHHSRSVRSFSFSFTTVHRVFIHHRLRAPAQTWTAATPQASVSRWGSCWPSCGPAAATPRPAPFSRACSRRCSSRQTTSRHARPMSTTPGES